MKDILVSSEEITKIISESPTSGAGYNAIGILVRIRSGEFENLTEAYKTSIEETTEDNHPNLDKAFEYLRGKAEKFAVDIE